MWRTRGRWNAVGVLLLGPALGSGCGEPAPSEPADGGLLARIQSSHYQTWGRPPGWEQRKVGIALHGDAVDIFFNSEMEQALKSPGLSEWPVGSMLVKDGYRSSVRTLTAVLEKREQGWVFAEYGASWEQKAFGQPEPCVGCHRDAVDSVYSVALP
ncbi:MAG: hypothetical protein SFV15_21715 [Polyangiaceae bacterium]|nr:hypothetical protein [Polyangiaceae bacterium]